MACRDCPLRPLKLFHERTNEELEIVQWLKRRERHLGVGDTCKSVCAGGLTPEVSRRQPLRAIRPLPSCTPGLWTVAKGCSWPATSVQGRAKVLTFGA